MCLAAQMYQCWVRSQGSSISRLGFPFPSRRFVKKSTNVFVTGVLEQVLSVPLQSHLEDARTRLRMLTINHSFGSLALVGSKPLNSALNEALTWLNNDTKPGINYIYYSTIEIPASVWNFCLSYRVFMWRI